MNLLEIVVFNFIFFIIVKTILCFLGIFNYLKISVRWHERPNRH